MRIGIMLDGGLLACKSDPQYDIDTNEMPYGHYGKLLPGAKKMVAQLKAKGWEIVIITYRSDLATVRGYILNELKIAFDKLASPGVPVACDVYLCPQTVTFEGEWSLDLVERLHRFRTWEEKKLKGKAKRGLSDRRKGIF